MEQEHKDITDRQIYETSIGPVCMSKTEYTMYQEEMAKNERFEKTYSQGTMNVTEIWVDKETGVNYLYHAAGYSGGLTPLLDRDGKPVISPIVNR